MSAKNSQQTIEQKLQAMSLEEFGMLLKNAAKVEGEHNPEHKEILEQLEGPEEATQVDELKKSSKYSSLQSLNQNEVHLPVSPSSTATIVQDKGSKGTTSTNPSYHSMSTTLPTINSTSSLNSIGVEGGGSGDHHAKISTPPLSQAYFFNERDDNHYTGQVSTSVLPTRRDSTIEHRTSFTGDSALGRPSHSRTLPLNDDYKSVASLTSAGSSAPSLVGASSSVKYNLNSNISNTRCSTPNFSSSNSISLTKSPSEGSNADRISTKPRVGDRSAKKKKDKHLQREKKVEVETLPGFRGNDPIENLVQFVEGIDSNAVTKKKKKETRSKDKETLVKSASLDENHLNLNSKRSGDEATSTSKSLKEVEKKSEKAVSANTIASLHGEVSLPPDSDSQNAKETKPNDISRFANSKESPRDESSDEPFELVQPKKRKLKQRSSTQREAETFSRGKVSEQARREQTRSRRREGDRRKSVGSVPGSENSDQSDDDSVRSLPAGECTPKEHVPKQCASSGGTPQTSYADIARISDANKLLSPPIGSPMKTPSSELIPKINSSTTKVSKDIEKIGAAEANGEKESKFPERNNSKGTQNQTKIPAIKTNSNGPITSSLPSKGNASNAPIQRRSHGEIIHTNSNCHTNDGIRVSIQDKTEFPEINASLPVKPLPSTKRLPTLNDTKKQTKPKLNDVLKAVESIENVVPYEKPVLIVQPVFVHPSKPNEEAPTTSPQADPSPLQNGVLDDDSPLAEGSTNRRNRESVSTSSGDVPVVFCGGIEREIPASQNIDCEFGFNVMMAISGPEAKCEHDQLIATDCTAESVQSPSAETESMVPQSPGEQCSIRIVPQGSKPDPGGEKVATRPSPRDSLLGTYRGPGHYQETRRGSHQYPTRHSRSSIQSYRGQRNGSVTFVAAQHPSNTPYPLHVTPAGIPAYPPPQIIAPGPGQNYATIVPVVSTYAMVNPNPARPVYVHAAAGSYVVPPHLPVVNMPMEGESSTSYPPSCGSYTVPVNAPRSQPLPAIITFDGMIPVGQQVYYSPAFPPIPMPSADVENWMNSNVQRVYNQGAGSSVHRIDDIH